MGRTFALTGRCGPIVLRFELALTKSGGHALRSFDLQSARASSNCDCPCPHHHTTDCTCQYVILIVYTAQTPLPRAVILHEFEGVTRVTLDDPEGVLTGLLLEHATEAV